MLQFLVDGPEVSGVVNDTENTGENADGQGDSESIGQDAHEDVLFEFGHLPGNGFDHSADDTPDCNGKFLHNQYL